MVLLSQVLSSLTFRCRCFNPDVDVPSTPAFSRNWMTDDKYGSVVSLIQFLSTSIATDCFQQNVVPVTKAVQTVDANKSFYPEKIVKLKRFFFLQNKGKSQEQGHSQTCYTCLETWSFTKKTFLSIFLHCCPVLLSRGFASAFFSSFLRIVDSVDCVMPNLSPTSLVYFSSPNAVRISDFSSRVSWHCLLEATSLFSHTDDIFFSSRQNSFSQQTTLVHSL